MNAPDKRGESVSLFGLLLVALGATVLFTLAIWSGSASVWAAAFQLAGGLGIWVLTLLQLHQARLVAEERLEVAELERSRKDMLGGTKTIFDEEELSQMESLAMGRRLRSIEKFLVPLLALATAAYNLVVGVGLLPWFKQFSFIADLKDTAIVSGSAVLFFAGGIAFVCFMFSRYCLGMARLREWQLLRAGGNFFFGASAINLAVAIALLCVMSGLAWLETWLSRTVGVVLIVVAVETILNYVLDFYRPRGQGQVQRSFYDSRLFGMFSEPGGILRSMANAIDYQFGFKVSETWFYRLLGRIVLPLFLVQIVVLLALTCITVVPPGHKAVIEHLGQGKDVVGPGVHLTWCWPIDQATIIPVEAVQRLEIGFERSRDPNTREFAEGAILWTKKHYKKEYLLLAADEGATVQRGGATDETLHGGASGGAPPINMLSMNMPVQWRIGDSDQDVLQFHSQAADVPWLIESLAYRELTRYAAEHDVYRLLGKGGIEAAATLHERLQKSCDEGGINGGSLGVRIIHVGIGGVHPPSDNEVAKSYEDVVGAYEAKDAKIKSAEGEAAELRIRCAGNGWADLYTAIEAEDKARMVKSADLGRKTEIVERLLREVVGGEARSRASIAEKKTLERVFSVKSSAEQYTMQVEAYRVAKDVYTLRLYLRLLADGLERIRKYVIVLEDSSRVLYELDLKPPQALDVLGAESAAIDVKQGK